MLIIKKKKINNIHRYIPKDITEFRVKSPIGMKNLSLNKGKECIKYVPEVIGPVSKFNAIGKHVLMKDLPKERRIVMQREWSWQDWGHNWHSQIVDISRLCYQRKFIAPPSQEFIIKEGEYFSNTLNKNNEQEALHVINLFLEKFGCCEIINKDFTEFNNVKNLNFIILPAGERPFKYIKSMCGKKGHASEKVMEDRDTFFRGLKPTEYLVGMYGLKGYIGYKYGDIVIFDNTAYGNAIYILKACNEDLCALTKKEILDAKIHLARIIHNKEWKKGIKSIIEEHIK